MNPELIQVQAGKQTVRATAVTPTVKRMGVTSFDLTPMVESIGHPSQRGSLAPAYDEDLQKVECEANEEGEVTFEDVDYLLDSMMDIATPSGSGPYTKAYAAPLSADPTPRIQTLVTGHGSNVYKGTGMVMDELTFSFAKNEPMKYSCHYFGTGISTATLAALNDRTLNYVMGQHVALYIDAFGGTIGSTAFTDAFFSGELNLKANRENYFSLGQLGPKGYTNPKWEATLKLTLEFAAASKAYFDAIIGASAVLKKLIRVKATKGTNELQFDFAGFTPSAPEAFTDEDGIVTVELEFSGLYESTFANYFKAKTINGVETLV